MTNMTAGQYRNLVAESKGPRRHKYGAKHVWLCAECHCWHDLKTDQCDSCGHKKMIFFASRAEASYAVGLLALQEADRIRNLIFQPKFPIYINNILIGSYLADFSYEDLATSPGGPWHGERHVIDVKGMDTPLSKFKRRCVESQYGIKIEIVNK